MTTSLIKEAIELPRKRFIEMVQKYVRHVKMKQMEERVKRARLEDDLGDKFIYMLEKRIQKVSFSLPFSFLFFLFWEGRGRRRFLVNLVPEVSTHKDSTQPLTMMNALRLS
jgi:hypothetical protein